MRATTVSSTSLLLRWLTLTIVLLAFGSAAAEDQHPLDLDATRTALTAIEAALRGKDLADADLQRLRSENDPFGVALQAAIAEMGASVMLPCQGGESPSDVKSWHM